MSIEVTDEMRRAVVNDFLSYFLIPEDVREYMTCYLEALDEEL